MTYGEVMVKCDVDGERGTVAQAGVWCVGGAIGGYISMCLSV